MLRLVVVVFLLVLVAACSRMELAYRNADRLLEYYAGRTLDISRTQREQWQPMLAATLQRHRDSELAYLVTYLDIAGRLVNEQGDVAGADCLVDGALRVSQQHARLAVDLAVPLLADLDQSQFEHLSAYTAKRQHKLAERYLNPDPELRKKSRHRRFNERVEKWIGRINPHQQVLVDEALQRIPDVTSFWLAYREQQNTALLDMLAAGTDAEALQPFLNSWWVEWEGRSTDYVQSWRIARLEFATFLDRLGDTLTPKQREKVVKRLSGLREDLAEFLPPEAVPVSMSTVASACVASGV